MCMWGVVDFVQSKFNSLKTGRNVFVCVFFPPSVIAMVEREAHPNGRKTRERERKNQDGGQNVNSSRPLHLVAFLYSIYKYIYKYIEILKREIFYDS